MLEWVETVIIMTASCMMDDRLMAENQGFSNYRIIKKVTKKAVKRSLGRDAWKRIPRGMDLVELVEIIKEVKKGEPRKGHSQEKEEEGGEVKRASRREQGEAMGWRVNRERKRTGEERKEGVEGRKRRQGKAGQEGSDMDKEPKEKSVSGEGGVKHTDPNARPETGKRGTQERGITKEGEGGKEDQYGTLRDKYSTRVRFGVGMVEPNGLHSKLIEGLKDKWNNEKDKPFIARVGATKADDKVRLAVRRYVKCRNKINIRDGKGRSKWNNGGGWENLRRKWDPDREIKWYEIIMKPQEWGLTEKEQEEQEEYKQKKVAFNEDISRNYIPREHRVMYRCVICGSPFNKKTIRTSLFHHMNKVHGGQGIGFCVELHFEGGRIISFKWDSTGRGSKGAGKG